MSLLCCVCEQVYTGSAEVVCSECRPKPLRKVTECEGKWSCMYNTIGGKDGLYILKHLLPEEAINWWDPDDCESGKWRITVEFWPDNAKEEP